MARNAFDHIIRQHADGMAQAILGTYHDVERGQRGSTEEHLTVTQFKVQQEQQRLNEIYEAQATAVAELEHLEADKAQAEKETRQVEAKLNHLHIN